jgi:acetyl esterase/lipase
MLADIRRSIRFVRHHADKYSIDVDSIGLFGASSGGHLALLAATTGTEEANEPSPDPVEREPSSIAAVVAIHPPTDLLNFGEEYRLISTHLRELGFANDGAWDFRAFDKTQGRFSPLNTVEALEMLRSLSPIYQITPDDPPALLVHGDADMNVPLSQSKRFVDRMTALGRQADLHIVEGKGHVPFQGINQVLVSFFKKHL